MNEINIKCTCSFARFVKYFVSCISQFHVWYSSFLMPPHVGRFLLIIFSIPHVRESFTFLFFILFSFIVLFQIIFLTPRYCKHRWRRRYPDNIKSFLNILTCIRARMGKPVFEIRSSIDYETHTYTVRNFT